MRAQRAPTKAIVAAVVLGLTLAGCAGPSGRAPNDEGTSAASESPSAAPRDDQPERGADLATTEFAVSWRDAVDIAKDGFPGELTEIELGWSGDEYAYTVKLLSESHLHTGLVSAESGDVISNHGEAVESSDMPEKRAEIIEYDGLVPWEEAVETALDAQDGTVNEWTLEGTKSGAQWQFDVDAESGEDYEVTVDAVSGNLITTDD